MQGLVQHANSWCKLGTTRRELCLDFTLPTGQSFRWRQLAASNYVGVIGQRVVQVQQLDDDVQYRVLARGPDAHPDGDHSSMRDYFNLDTLLQPLTAQWCAADARFSALSQYFPGARVLRQNPVECLFQFICSSNNHISRITGMVERLCSSYGTMLCDDATLRSSTSCTADYDSDVALSEVKSSTKKAQDVKSLLNLHAFPTLQQLSKATEDELRAHGFGYRAKYVVGSVAALNDKDNGGEEWLLSLRRASYADACAELCTLPGVGPKVAACICLFSLDKHAAIPVDTHVWQVAVKHYTPHLRGKTLTKPLMAQVERAFVDRFGDYAGWAHNTLFIADLASQQHHLPDHLRASADAASKRRKRAKTETMLQRNDTASTLTVMS